MQRNTVVGIGVVHREVNRFYPMDSTFFDGRGKSIVGADRPSSEVIINNDLVASFGARLTKFHWAALEKTSLARISGVVTASGAMPSAAGAATRLLTAAGARQARPTGTDRTGKVRPLQVFCFGQR